MTHLKFMLVTSFLGAFTCSFAQSESQSSSSNNTWQIGTGWNIVDDNGEKGSKLFDASDSWNALSYPSTLKVEKLFNKGFSLALNMSINKFKPGKLVNGEKITTTSNLIAVDLIGKYNFSELLHPEKRIIDIYGAHGYGFTYRDHAKFGNVATADFGFGINAWVFRNLGVNIEAMAKFGLTEPLIKTGTNYTQYSVGLVYQLSPPTHQADGNSSWILGVGWNIVDDNGLKSEKIFDVSGSWNLSPYPTTIKVEKVFDKGFSLALNAANNTYEKGKLVNGEKVTTSTTNFLSFDLNGKYNFCHLYDINTKLFHFEKQVFDIYATHGYGVTFRDHAKYGTVATANLGGGLNAWVLGDFGINIEAVGKFGIEKPFIKTGSNYTQYSFGIVYKLQPVHQNNSNTEKTLSNGETIKDATTTSETTKQDTTNTSKVVEEVKTETENISKPDSLKAEIKPADVQKEISETPKDAPGTSYEVILGSYKHKKNAEEYQRYLQKKLSMETKIFQINNNPESSFYLSLKKSFDNYKDCKAEVLKTRELFKKESLKVPKGDAWLKVTK